MGASYSGIEGKLSKRERRRLREQATTSAPAPKPQLDLHCVLYAGAISVSAALIFFVQPMVAKMLLPLLGGVPAVWTTCMVFFQVVLLAGYLYAHALGKKPLKFQVVFHVSLLVVAAVTLPIGIPRLGIIGSDVSRIVVVLTLLGLAVGLPFFALSATAPLLQHWFSKMNRAASRDPYFLYAASNFGSLAALVAYPILVEPSVGLRAQSHLWTGGYLVLAALIGGCGHLLLKEAKTTGEVATEDSSTAPSLRQKITWVGLAFVPSSLMLGVTTYFTTDIATIPLLWIIPLTLYLVSFILVYAKMPDWTEVWAARMTPLAVVGLLCLMASTGYHDIFFTLACHLGVFFLVSIVFHGGIAKTRPSPTHLTEYYLLMSLGGMLGGMFNGIAAPLVFKTATEYPIALVAVCLLAPVAAYPLLARVARFVFSVGAIVLVAMPTSPTSQDTIHRERSFFGTLKIYNDAEGKFRTLINGTTLHGRQAIDEDLRKIPMTYYHWQGPVGEIFSEFSTSTRKLSYAVVGLGTGTLAAYGKAGQKVTFYEIDTSVVAIAQKYFYYLADSKADVNIVVGDARLKLAEAADESYGLILVDAFSSDAIPVHLLTQEALKLYFQKLTSDGLLAIHTSNRYLSLQPVLANLAAENGVAMRVSFDVGDDTVGRSASTWVVFSRNEYSFGALSTSATWKKLDRQPWAPLWTDDFTSVLPLLR